MSTRESVEFVERLSGRIEKHAANIAEEIIKDLQLATHYPPQHDWEEVTVADVVSKIQQLTHKIQAKRQEITSVD